MQEKILSTLNIHKLTEEQYNKEVSNGNVDEYALYLTPDEGVDLSPYATIEELNKKANASDLSTHTKNTLNPHNVTKEQIGLNNVDNTSDVDKPISKAVQNALNNKANLEHAHDYDSAFSTSSTNPVQNKVVTAKVNSLQSAVDSKVPIERTVNGKPLSEDIELSASDVNADSVGTADSKVSDHNASASAHSDIRILITTLTTRLNTLADSDDETLDQMSELVEYIKANRSLIEEVTTKKVNVADIIDNLTTNVTNKPLSAAQGVAIKSLIDSLQSVVDGKANAVHSHSISDVTELQSALDGKSGTDHTHNLSSLINALDTDTDTPTDSDYFVSQYVSGGNTTTTYYRRPLSALWSYIKSKLASVAVSGSYDDLEDRPTIGDGTITIYQNGTQKGSFTMNQTGDTTIELTDNDTDTKVTNTLATTTRAYVTGTTSSETNTGTQVFDTDVYLDTTAGQLVANTFKGSLIGNADTASKLGSSTIGSSTTPMYLSSGTPTASTASIGSSTQPIYMNNGAITRCSYSLQKSVPSDAVFTDTTYSVATSSADGLMSMSDKSRLDSIGDTKVLWWGTYRMLASDTINLQESVSSQVNGIVLVWSSYYSGTVQNDNFQYVFIPKYHITNATFAGKLVQMMLTTGQFATMTTKGLWVADTSITGHSDNGMKGTSSGSGINFDNTAFVLRYVLGV